MSLSKIHLLVIPRKRWPHPNMTEKLFTGIFSKKKTTTEKHVNLKTGLNIMHLYCITNTSIINKTTPLQVITELLLSIDITIHISGRPFDGLSTGTPSGFPRNPKLMPAKVRYMIMPPTLKKLMGHIAFGACVGACVRHTFCTYCNF